MAAPNLSVQYSDRPETYEVLGRISAAGAILAPASGAKFTVGHTASTGVYTINLQYIPAEFLGASVTIESSTIPGTNTAALDFVASYAPGVLTVTIYNQAATPVGTDSQFSFCITASDSLVP